MRPANHPVHHAAKHNWFRATIAKDAFNNVGAPAIIPKLCWAHIYRETELYKSAVRLYTKPLFQWRKALVTSHDGGTLYDFARHGLRSLAALHRELAAERFVFRPGLAMHRNFNCKSRTLYIFPWQERLVDLLLYRLLNRALDQQMSRSSYAYRISGFGVDRCQRAIQKSLRASQTLYVLKRDIAEFFDSIDHEILLNRLASVVSPSDYLFELIQQRVRFSYMDGGAVHIASRGVPFGTAIACFLANFYLRELDEAWELIPGLVFFRYADDLLALSASRDVHRAAATAVDMHLRALRLISKPSHALDFCFGDKSAGAHDLPVMDRFRHLGLEFRTGGGVGLARDKFRKICNLFRFACRKKRGSFRRMRDPRARARLAVEVCRQTIDAGVRNVAIIDYYLRHVNDEGQLRLLDRWLAEHVLSLALAGGHKRGYFRSLPFRELRVMGLPSLVHRRRLLRNRRIDSSFFIWKGVQANRLGREKSHPSITG